MRRLLAFVIWCVVGLVGVILVIFPSHSWQCDPLFYPQPNDIFYSPNANTVLHQSKQANYIELWRDNESPIHYTFAAFASLSNTVSISPDGNLAASYQNGLISVWNTNSGSTVFTLSSGETDLSLPRIFSPDGKYLLQAGDGYGTIRWWDIHTGQLHHLIDTKAPVTVATFSSDGKRIITGDGKGWGTLWDVESGQLLWKSSIYLGLIAFAQFSPDNQRVVISDHSSVLVIDTRTGQTIQFFESGNEIAAKAIFTQNGNELLTLYGTGLAKLWDVQSGELLYTLHDPDTVITSIAMSPDGESIVSVNYHGILRLWATDTGQLKKTFRNQFYPLANVYKSPFSSSEFLAYSADGQRILSGDALDDAMWWDAQTGELIRPLCPLALDQRWIATGVGLCMAAIVAAVGFFMRTPSPQSAIMR